LAVLHFVTEKVTS